VPSGSPPRQGFDGIVAIGCVIRGETPHFEYVAGRRRIGLARRPLRRTACRVAFGVLTTETEEQAMARAGGGKGNKGWEAALAVLEMAGPPSAAAVNDQPALAGPGAGRCRRSTPGRRAASRSRSKAFLSQFLSERRVSQAAVSYVVELLEGLA
jgi:hypothetical protein